MKGLSCLFQRDCQVRRFPSWFLVGLVFLSCLAIIGCGGGGSSRSSDNNIESYTVSGQVSENSAGLQGVTLTFDNGATSVTTDASGNWSKSGLSGTVTVTPSLAGYIFSPATITVGNARNDLIFTATRINIAYIYGDSTAANNFKALLEPTYPTDLIMKSNIESTSFTKYSLIIIGRGAPLFTTGQVTTIRNTNLPVIGISGGGLDYFGKIGLNMKGDNVASGQTTQAIVIDATLPIWSRPNALNVSNGSTVTIYSSDSSANVLYKPYLDTGGVHVAGYNVSYDTIAKVGTNLYWAYYNDASGFTDTGQRLFINAVAYMTQ